jgi:hypothetical protein
MSTFTKQLIGPRSKHPASVVDVLTRVEKALRELGNGQPEDIRSVRNLKECFSGACTAYYAMAAASRRKHINDADRKILLSTLFSVRTRIEAAVIFASPLALNIWDAAYTNRFFGFSKKQGVSLRYPLISCVPTSMCGGRCYAHDGHDRELHLIFRAIFNYLIGRDFENKASNERSLILARLEPIAAHAVANAIEDQKTAYINGYNRSPRIRFSHIGEVAETPEFANALAQIIKRINPEVECIIYTRHPKAHQLDTELFTTNFTIESESDSRNRFIPAGARVVASSWNGDLVEGAEINFVEHHVEKASLAKGRGAVCPVSVNHKETPSCDSARCCACFVPPC